MNTYNTVLVDDYHGKPISLDITYQNNDLAKPIVIFAHGFKGFKDWGIWSHLAKAFAEAGFAFLKFNFSFNGTTPERPIDFVDLEAFGQNNYSRELENVQTVLNWLFTKAPQEIMQNIDLDKVAMAGHSRGGPIAILTAEKDDRIKSVLTWAGVHKLDYAWSNEETLKAWKDLGVMYILNGRTGQQMPLYYQLYANFLTNQEGLNTKTALAKLQKPMLIVHGTNDPAVHFDAAKQLNAWYPAAEVILIDGADHVFGGRHPYSEENLPEHASQLVHGSVAFLQKHL